MPLKLSSKAIDLSDDLQTRVSPVFPVTSPGTWGFVCLSSGVTGVPKLTSRRSLNSVSGVSLDSLATWRSF